MARTHVPEEGVEYVEANGLRFAYHSAGEGPLVLLMHGFPDTARTWSAWLPALAKAGYRAVSPYLRGYAPSALPDRDTDARTQCDDVLALIEALGYERAVLVGHDWGATGVIGAAALAPDKVEQLITLAIPHPAAIKPSLKLLWEGRHFLALRLPGAVSRFAANDYAGVDRLVARWAPKWQLPPGELDAVKNCFAAPGALNAALGYYRALDPKPPKFMRAKISVPTLAIAGREDIAPLPAYEAARRRFTGSYEVVELQCGHFPQRERAEECLGHALRFLRS